MATPKCPKTGKRQYPGSLRAAEALGRAKAARNLWNDGPEPIRYYRCEFCSRYHLTHKPLREKIDHG
jgi:hypothetical protein